MPAPDQGCPTTRPKQRTRNISSASYYRRSLSPSHNFLSVTKPTPHKTSSQVGLPLQMLYPNILHFSYVNALLKTSSHLPSPLLVVISSNLPSLSPIFPDMNFYLISQITSAHLTSNSMLCDNTLLCPRTLFTSPMGS